MKRDSCKVEEFKIDEEVNDKSNDFLILNDEKVYFKDIKQINIKSYLKFNKEITKSEHEHEVIIITNNKEYCYIVFENNKEMYMNYIDLIVKIKKYKIKQKQEYITDNEKIKTRKKSMLPIYILFASPIVIGVIAFIIYLNTPNYYEESQEEKNNIKSEQLKINRERCSNQSDTYHKCKWSISENRCICKQR